MGKAIQGPTKEGQDRNTAKLRRTASEEDDGMKGYPVEFVFDGRISRFALWIETRDGDKFAALLESEKVVSADSLSDILLHSKRLNLDSPALVTLIIDIDLIIKLIESIIPGKIINETHCSALLNFINTLNDMLRTFNEEIVDAKKSNIDKIAIKLFLGNNLPSAGVAAHETALSKNELADLNKYIAKGAEYMRRKVLG